MKITSTNSPKLNSGIVRGTPRTITTVTKLNTVAMFPGVTTGIPKSTHESLVDVLVTWKDERVDTAVNPATCVDEVELVTVVVTDVTLIVIAEGVQACMGPSDLPLGIMVVASAKTVTASKAYFTQHVPILIKQTRHEVGFLKLIRHCSILAIRLRVGIGLRNGRGLAASILN